MANRNARTPAAQTETAPVSTPAPAAPAPATETAAPTPVVPAIKDTRVAGRMVAAVAVVTAAGVSAPVTVLDTADLAPAATMPRKVHGGAKFNVADLPPAGAWFVGRGTTAAPSRGDGMGGIAQQLDLLAPDKGQAVDLRALVLACMLRGIDASYLGGSTRAFTNGGKCKVAAGIGQAPFTLYNGPPAKA